ncbi:hypothetical protein EON64_07370 [archaeon]|nr:MAG: hypothetical protein EON64_07370 [archaeon]
MSGWLELKDIALLDSVLNGKDRLSFHTLLRSPLLFNRLCCTPSIEAAWSTYNPEILFNLMDWLQARHLVFDKFDLHSGCRELANRFSTKEAIEAYSFVTMIRLTAFDPSLTLQLIRILVNCFPCLQNISVIVHAPIAMSALLDILNVLAAASATAWQSLHIHGYCEMSPELSQDMCRVLHKQGAQLRDFQITRGTEQMLQCLVETCPQLTTVPSFVHTLGMKPPALLQVYRQSARAP